VSAEPTTITPADWDRAVADADGPQLVVGGPGTGKTEFLVRRAVHLADSGTAPERILMLSFSRRAAAGLRRRVITALERSLTVVPALTFHALSMRIVEAHGPGSGWDGVPALLTGPEQVEMVAELLPDEDPAAWPVLFRPLLGTRAFAEEVTDFLLRSAERLFGPAEVRAADRDDWAALPGFMERYHVALVAAGRIDYGTLQAEAVRLLEDPEVRSLVTSAFDHVLVDEYQDTTLAQAVILERLAAAHGNISAVGDPYQSVYSFRGAELDNIARFPERFEAATGRPVRHLVLGTSFRVPQAILDAAVRVTAGGQLPGTGGPVVPAPGDGAVETFCFDQQTHEAEWIASEIEHTHLRDGIPYGRMAVLVRSKRRFLPELGRALARRGIPHEPPDRRLVDSPMVRTVLDLARAAAGGPRAGDAVRRLVAGPLVGLTLGEVREIERAVARGRPWHEAVTDLIVDGSALGSLIADAAWATDRPAVDGLWHAWSTVPQFRRIADPDDAAAGDHRAALASLGQVLSRLAERDRSVTLARYATWSEEEDFEATPLLEYKAGAADRVVLTTLHQAKGHEYDVVFIADAREGVLPDLRVRDSLLGTGALGGRGPDEYVRFRLQEEKRLAYTAMTRARLRVVWTCSSIGFTDGGGLPSRFLSLVAGKPMEQAALPPPIDRMPVTRLEAEAWLRRIAADPSADHSRRLAAIDLLVRGEEHGLRPSAGFHGILEPGPDTGLVPPGARLSPSQAESYATCPRKYAFESRLSVDDSRSAYLELGSLVHDVLEIVETEAMEAGDRHGTLQRALEVLEDRFVPADFGGGAWAEAWRERAARMIGRLYEMWPGTGHPVGLEERVETEIGGVTWRGRIDRTERRDDGDHIIDYKTSGSAMSKHDAASNLQLGFYVLASGGPEAGIAGAELWYPATTTKTMIATRSFDMANLDDVEARLAAAAEGVMSERWDPLPGDHCGRCPVRLVCPAWPEGRETFA
jgi:superfamily I DNA/RNA helicase/RecB family exonuclease